MKLNILVFPCGSEVGLEIYRSLNLNKHFVLYGASSIDDHGKFCYKNYIGGIPFFSEENFPKIMKEIVDEYKIDVIFPATDAVSLALKLLEEELGCKVIGSSIETTKICRSKRQTYEVLNNVVLVPKIFSSLDEIENYPVFMKPDDGHGSRNQLLAFKSSEILNHRQRNGDVEFIICEFLPGMELTVDCFSSFEGKVLWAKPRVRGRISNGISVNTFEYKGDQKKVEVFAESINKKIKPRGAWFYQLKRNKDGEFCLLEVATRLGGSSSLYRNKGVNFAALSIYDCFDIKVDICANNYEIELDRALSNRYFVNISYKHLYIDYDDCIVCDRIVNLQAIKYLYQCINNGVKITLISRHAGNLKDSLLKYRLYALFDEIVHVTDGSPKYHFINSAESIFIDDSHSERKDVARHLGIPVFSVDMIEALMN